MPDLNIDLLKHLCETPGIAGREDAVRALVREELAGLVDEIRTDALGNLIGVRRGSGGPRVMLAAHMDEIGFIVRHIDERGFIRIQPVGASTRAVCQPSVSPSTPTTARPFAVQSASPASRSTCRPPTRSAHPASMTCLSISASTATPHGPPSKSAT